MGIDFKKRIINKFENPYLFFEDLETTGFSPKKNAIIQLSGIIAKPIDGELQEVARFNEFCRPGKNDYWSEGAEEHHGIPYHKAIKFQEPRKMLIKFLHFLLPFKSEDNSPIKFVCHAKNKFDLKFTKELFIKEGLITSFDKVFNDDHYESTIDLAEKYKSVTGLKNNKLDTLTSYFEINHNHHEGLSDALACFQIYKNFKKMKLGLGLFHDE